MDDYHEHGTDYVLFVMRHQQQDSLGCDTLSEAVKAAKFGEDESWSVADHVTDRSGRVVLDRSALRAAISALSTSDRTTSDRRL